MDSSHDAIAQNIEKAESLKRAGTLPSLELALSCYEDALSGMLDRMRVASADKQPELAGIVEVYMAEAEELKSVVEGMKQSTPPPIASPLPLPLPPPPAPALPADARDYTAEFRLKRQQAKSSSAGAAAAAPRPAGKSLYATFQSSLSKAAAAATAPAQATTKRAMPASPRLAPAAPSSSSSSSNSGGGGGGGGGGTAPHGAPARAAAAKLNDYEKQLLSELLDATPGVRWDHIAGLGFAKQTLQEAVILPNLRPDLFTGLRSPPKGVLLFGPPGTGKTLLAKAVACESGFAFFSVTAANVTSKYLGEGEKLMKAIFSLARTLQPSVIFFDEIDALMSARKESEHEASRRLKTEFMTQLDGATTSGEDRILVMAATNIPWELDEAVLRRLVKRIYVPLPDADSRRALIIHLMQKQGAGGAAMLANADGRLDRVVAATAGYSGSDLSALCAEAAMAPIRKISAAALLKVKAEDVRLLHEQDFLGAVRVVRPSVSPESLAKYTQWSASFATAS